jgi:drug/metabolite transporter (DMT)-like permease
LFFSSCHKTNVCKREQHCNLHPHSSPALKKLSHIIAFIALSLIWGSSFILMKKGLRNGMGQPMLSPSQVAACRMGIAGLFFLPFALPALRRVRRSDLPYLAVVGFIGSAIPAFLFASAQTQINSSIAGILNSLTPLFTLLIGALLFKKSILSKQMTGVIVAFLGTAALLIIHGLGQSNNIWFGLEIVLATCCYGISVNTISAKIPHLKSLDIASISLLMASIPWTIYVFNTDLIQVVTERPGGWNAFAAIATLSLLGTCLANLLYFWLTQHTSPMVASTVTYVMPLVSVGWGLLDHEDFHPLYIACAAAILIGIRWIHISGRKTINITESDGEASV